MNVVKKAVDILNPGQVPINTVDQPLFTIAKQIQENWTASHGEDQFIVMFGGLHIEVAAFKTIGDLLDNSGWTGPLVRASVATPGTASRFISSQHSCDAHPANPPASDHSKQLVSSSVKSFLGVPQ